MLSFRKKLKSQFQENLQTEGRTDLIHKTLLAMTGGPIRELKEIAVDNKNKIQNDSAYHTSLT